MHCAPAPIDRRLLGRWDWTNVRNICALHGRLWKRRLTVTPVLPSMPTNLAASVHQTAAREIYNTLTMIQQMMTIIAPPWSRMIRGNGALGFELRVTRTFTIDGGEDARSSRYERHLPFIA